MLTHAEQQSTAAPAMPAVSECAAALLDYAAAIGNALEQTPRAYEGAPYLPTRRTIREAENAAAVLMASASALSQAPHFYAPVRVPGGYARPVDLLAAVLEASQRAGAAMESHQQGTATPRANRLGLVVLGEWVNLTACDLSALLTPVCELLGSDRP